MMNESEKKKLEAFHTITKLLTNLPEEDRGRILASLNELWPSRTSRPVTLARRRD